MTAAPRFSILTPVYDTPEHVLVECVESVLAQTCPDWELLLVDDASPSGHVAGVLDRFVAADPRIRGLRRPANGGIVAATNDALTVATGEFVALLDHDDLLAPTALAELAAMIDLADDVDVVYTDEDKIDERGIGFAYGAFRKPDWSPVRLTNQMYLGHLLTMRRSLVEEVGGFRPAYEGSQDWDLALRVTERARRIEHVRQVLYHWRASATSTALQTELKPYAVEAGRRAVLDHFARRGIEADARLVHRSGVFGVTRQLEREPLVSIVIPSRGTAALIDGRFRTLLTGAVRSITERSTYPNYEVVAVLDRGTPPGAVTELETMLGERLTVVWYDRPFNFSDKTNCGVLAASGEFVLLLNDDVEVITPRWLEAMLSLALEPGVGLVGAKLYFADGTLQHAGHLYTGLNAGHVGLHAPHDDPGYFTGYVLEREASGVTAACALVPRELYLRVGGFTMALPGNFNDVDFSMKISGTGHRILWTPHAQLFHFESKSRVSSVQAYEIELIHRRWSDRMRLDRYWWAPGLPTPGEKQDIYTVSA